MFCSSCVRQSAQHSQQVSRVWALCAEAIRKLLPFPCVALTSPRIWSLFSLEIHDYWPWRQLSPTIVCYPHLVPSEVAPPVRMPSHFRGELGQSLTCIAVTLWMGQGDAVCPLIATPCTTVTIGAQQAGRRSKMLNLLWSVQIIVISHSLFLFSLVIYRCTCTGWIFQTVCQTKAYLIISSFSDDASLTKRLYPYCLSLGLRHCEWNVCCAITYMEDLKHYWA